jgi:hypothetical protein
MDMTKFGTLDDPGFVAVTGEIRRWVKALVVSADDSNSIRESTEETQKRHMAPRRVAIARAGILGSLQYNDNVQSWLIELGKFLAIYELVQAHISPSVVEKTTLEARTAIHQILTQQRIPFSLPDNPVLTTNEAGRQVHTLLGLLRALGDPSHVAIVLIAQCACILRQEPAICNGSSANSEAIVGFARGRLSDIEQEAREVDLDTDALWNVLRSQPLQRLTTSGTRSLLVELSK